MNIAVADELEKDITTQLEEKAESIREERSKRYHIYQGFELNIDPNKYNILGNINDIIAKIAYNFLKKLFLTDNVFVYDLSCSLHRYIKFDTLHIPKHYFHKNEEFILHVSPIILINAYGDTWAVTTTFYGSCSYYNALGDLIEKLMMFKGPTRKDKIRALYSLKQYLSLKDRNKYLDFLNANEEERLLMLVL